MEDLEMNTQGLIEMNLSEMTEVEGGSYGPPINSLAMAGVVANAWYNASIEAMLR
jgi:hypothetical protein